MGNINCKKYNFCKWQIASHDAFCFSLICSHNYMIMELDKSEIETYNTRKKNREEKNKKKMKNKKLIIDI